MGSRLPADCLREIFEFLHDDTKSLHSFLLINRLWCETTVPILWRNTRNWLSNSHFNDKSTQILFTTLLSCLPEDSKKLLSDNGIIIPPPTAQPPLFEYAAFCRRLYYNDICYIVEVAIGDRQLGNSRNLYGKHLIKQEMFRMFLTRCSTIDFLDISDRNVPDLPLPYFAGAETSLSHLCELRCNMEIPPSIFYRMAQICRNIESLFIGYYPFDNDGLATLIEVQKRLKNFECQSQIRYTETLEDKPPYVNIASALATCSNTLTNLTFGGDLICIPSSTIAEIVNLQVLKLDFNHFNRNLNEEILESLEFTAFPNLKMLKMGGILAPLIMLGRLIRRTRNNLESISLHGWSKPDPKPIGTFNRVVAQYAPKLKYLTTCLDNPLDGDLLFEMLGNLCHEKFSKLRIAGKWTFTPKGLKKFFEKRKKKKRSFSLYICDCYDEVDSCIEITKSHNQVIERYKAEGILKNYKIEYDFTGDF
ncbi:9917_t:CDS:2 [Funneliformis caledonium]|uniref:9917_t:CDS:1 n=1 Tax=Funneliformis caledonium TaxID=1117310 RepID=A0A9N8V7B7_9GLOM|nr:9917_t:CDS:2 [Funneliformis caledonium]